MKKRKFFTSRPKRDNQSSNQRLVIHLLPNAHLDPVWFWDWREGLNEGAITVRTILDLMDECPDLTFIRGESAIYEHIQKTDKPLFRRMVKRIEEGRWDVVGGTVIQPDTNLPSTEVLCREFEMGLSYFERELGVRPKVAWQADSFGHSAGLPNIFSAFGFEGFAFTRPQRGQFKMDSPVFEWEGDHGNEILCYRQHWDWYGSERDNIHKILDHTLACSIRLNLPIAGVKFGLGNHGGGPTRRHITEIAQWQKLHPEVEVRYSTLHRFFEALKEIVEEGKVTVPKFKGEFGFCLRGCYSSVQRFKTQFRRAEALIGDTEITRSIIGSSLGSETRNLDKAWRALCFNAFHDILPGSSIERAYDDQTAWLGSAVHCALESRFQALNILAERIDTQTPPPRRDDLPKDVPFVIWNPLPRTFSGLAEIEFSLDYRPIWQFTGRANELPLVVFSDNGRETAFQEIETEHTSLPDFPWRKRLLVPVVIPALGWTTLQAGWRDEEKDQSKRPKVGIKPEAAKAKIEKGSWLVERSGSDILIKKNRQNFFGADRHLEIRTVEDKWGSWGGMNEEPDSISLENVTQRWRLSECHVIEDGKFRSKMWTRWQGGDSWIDLTFILSTQSQLLRVEARLLCNERSKRLKMVIPCSGQTEYDVAGGKIRRDEKGQVPGGRWATRASGGNYLGFCSDVLGDFDSSDDELRVTLARATRYANDVPTLADEKKWQPAVDCGELKFEFGFFDADVDADEAVDELIHRPTAVIAPGKKGSLPSRGSLGGITPKSVRLLSLESCPEGILRVRLQNRGSRSTHASIQLGLKRTRTRVLKPQEILTVSLKQTKETP